ncbi:MAG: hypothetical protein Q4A31_08515 [Corynebacterium sp.]|uniref:hypothetical protein n=1 Tax=Corynebacterium sp. TaxID=1720 RepID=UPI0026DD52AC|nr:hypothetical protein [Corynebacterium sp.]MDO4761944.1 hypothetical protein [Corynebacterium sp.]
MPRIGSKGELVGGIVADLLFLVGILAGSMDPFAFFLSQPSVAQRRDVAVKKVRAVHRRPVSLRKSDITSAESVLRAAKIVPALSPAPLSLECCVSGLSVLAPAQREVSAGLFVRAPLQLLARVDVLLGGVGRPVDAAAAACLSTLAAVVTNPRAQQELLPAVVHATIVRGAVFGPRSVAVAVVASRVAAVAVGFDPLGLCVPEVFFNRHKKTYAQLLANTDSAEGMTKWCEFYLDAMSAGADEAEGIAAAVR